MSLRARPLKRPRLCVVIPVFNEEAVLPRIYQELASVLAKIDVTWSVLVVNDGSSDSTIDTIERLFREHERMEYVVLSRNFGHQGALTAGLDYAEGDIVISMDADFQHPPELIPVMIEAWRAGYDVVHAQKTRTEGRSQRDTVAAAITYGTVSRLARPRIIPHASDFRLLDRAALEALRSMPERGRLYRGLTTWIGFRQCVISFIAPERAAGKSGYRLGQRLVVVARELFDFSNLPLYIGLLLGGAALLFSVLYAVFIAIWYFTGQDRPPGWASLISVTLILNSIGLLFLGIIGVYVARIYEEVRGRPPYVITAVRKHAKNEARADDL